MDARPVVQPLLKQLDPPFSIELTWAGEGPTWRPRKDYFVRSRRNSATGMVDESITYSDHFPVDYAF